MTRDRSMRHLLAAVRVYRAVGIGYRVMDAEPTDPRLGDERFVRRTGSQGKPHGSYSSALRQSPPSTDSRDRRYQQERPVRQNLHTQKPLRRMRVSTYATNGDNYDYVVIDGEPWPRKRLRG